MSAKPLKILVADDGAANFAMVSAVASHLGHSVVTAHDGLEAVRRYREVAPDLVFLGVMMPQMDGLAAVREMRSLAAERWVPVVLLAAPDRMDDVIEGLACGGDDYLVEPVDARLLRAKIDAYARAIALQRELIDYVEELGQWQSRQRSEQELARHVMARLTDAGVALDPLVQIYNRPADHFSGDLICTARTPADVLHVLLADAAGHGLAAALSAMPLPQVFYGMTAKGFSLSAIAAELNRKIERLMPADRFVAATLAAIDVQQQTIEVWNGGNPAAIYVDASGGVTRWPSRHVPLGILPPETFSDATEIGRIQGGGTLLLCSDGLIDIERESSERLGLAAVEQVLRQAPASARFHRLVDTLQAALDSAAVHDDISLACVQVPRERRQRARIRQAEPVQAAVSDWRCTLSWGAAELRSIDVVQVALSILSQLQALKPHQGALFLIVSELYNNALDHGLLGLDSAIKEQQGGFERYLEQRARRLQALSEGSIELGFHLRMAAGQAVLDIRVRDSGPGFDYADYLAPQADADRRPHGRGIALVRSLCRELVYKGCGNEVLARYAL